MDPPDHGRLVDVSSDPPSAASRDRQPPSERRRYLGVRFACCDAYTRIYPNRTQSAYIGHCPRCGRRIEFAIGPDGTDARFFTVG